MAEFNNIVGPWLSEICFSAWVLTGLFLTPIIKKTKNLDALIPLSYLFLLILIANIPAFWDSSLYTLLAHLYLMTGLFICYSIYDLVRGKFGGNLLVLSYAIVFLDVIFLAFDWYVQYRIWLTGFIFIAMCAITARSGLKSPESDGYLGGRPNETYYYRQKGVKES